MIWAIVIILIMFLVSVLGFEVEGWVVVFGMAIAAVLIAADIIRTNRELKNGGKK